MSNVRKLIRKIAKDGREVYAIPGTVSAISGTTCTVQPLNGDAELFGILLSGDDTSDILITPKIGSVVMVTMISDAEGFLSAWSQVDSVTFHDGKNGGIPISKSVAAKLSVLESRINQLEQSMATHTHSVVSVGSPTGTATPPYVPQPIIQTEAKDLENQKIKH